MTTDSAAAQDGTSAGLAAIERELVTLEASVAAMDRARHEATFGPWEARERLRQLRERRRMLLAEALADRTDPQWRARLAAAEEREAAARAAYDRYQAAWLAEELAASTVNGEPSRIRGERLVFRPGEADIDEKLAEREWVAARAAVRRLRSWPLRLLEHGERRFYAVAADGTRTMVDRNPSAGERPTIRARARNRILGPFGGHDGAA